MSRLYFLQKGNDALNIVQTTAFGRLKMKLFSKQIDALESAVEEIANKPNLGELKKGDLQGIRVYKFKVTNQAYLLAYTEVKNIITLLLFGSHENFYRDLKKLVKNL